jgi:thymidylate synthase (FAD)
MTTANTHTPSVNIVWATPDLDNTIAYIARVSNPDNQKNPSIIGLLQYMMREGHVSPFEMANVTLEINTTRDIGRQVLRHRSFSFQEFSQRYQDVTLLGSFSVKETRLQDKKNRQSSLLSLNEDTNQWWENEQEKINAEIARVYKEALDKGIAKEQARTILPEGNTPSRMYMNGNIRSWVFYLKQRLHETTQKEHRDLALEVLENLRKVAPTTMEAFFPLQ